jgi:hypothetical protein
MATKIRKTDFGVEICWNYTENGLNVWETYYTKAMIDLVAGKTPRAKEGFFKRHFGRD